MLVSALLIAILYWRWIEPMGKDSVIPDGLVSRYTLGAAPLVDASDVPFLTRMDQEMQVIAQKVRPAVVAIDGKENITIAKLDRAARALTYNTYRTDSWGTGVIVSKEGHIITSNHVVSGPRKFLVTLYNGKRCMAEKMGEDWYSDIAVLKINTSEIIEPATLNVNPDFPMGQIVISMGNAYGLGIGITKGMVSARRYDSLNNRLYLIQNDAAIHPGHSGGPLLNIRGEVIGINKSRHLPVGFDDSKEGVPNLGFAIPARKVMDSFQDICHFPQWVLLNYGIYAVNKPERELSKYYEYLQVPQASGVIIDRVVEGSLGNAAGIRKGDIITSCNGLKVESYTQLQQILKYVPMEEPVHLTLWRGPRGGEPVGEYKCKIDITPTKALSSRSVNALQYEIDFLKIRFEKPSITQEVANGGPGFVVTTIASTSPLLGKLKVGDVIDSINEMPFLEEEDIVNAFSDSADSYRFSFIRDGQRQTKAVYLKR